MRKKEERVCMGERREMEKERRVKKEGGKMKKTSNQCKGHQFTKIWLVCAHTHTHT